MIDVKELRIGNTINIKNLSGEIYNYANVVGIMENEIFFENGFGGSCDQNSIGFVEPIPLTDDTLFKCKLNEHLNVGSMCEVTERKGSFYLTVNSNEYVLRELKYLHQLQNLYFALTGNELEIKL